LFFFSLAVVASIRGVYHLSWFLLLASLAISLTKRRWRTALAAAAAPMLMIGAFYVKNYAMFGDLIPGQVYKKMNYADMVQQQAPDGAIERLTSEGRIGRILEIPAIGTRIDRYAEFVREPTPTGIPLLDMRKKTTGVDNWHSTWMAKVADCCGCRSALTCAPICCRQPAWLPSRVPEMPIASGLS
jgi:hypothetical protein